MARGLVDYFPDALAAVAQVSMKGAKKHGTFDAEGNPTWDKSKSTDHADCIIRHLADRGEYQQDGTRHSAALAWRALALLQIELDNDKVQASGLDQFTAFEATMKKAGYEGDTATMTAAAEEFGAASSQQQAAMDPVSDFAMWLTTRPQTFLVGGTATVYAMLEALKEWQERTFMNGQQWTEAEILKAKASVDMGDPKGDRTALWMLLNAKSAGVELVPPVPRGVWWCVMCNVFHAIGQPNGSWTDYDPSPEFQKTWKARRAEFPKKRSAALASLTPAQNR